MYSCHQGTGIHSNESLYVVLAYWHVIDEQINVSHSTIMFEPTKSLKELENSWRGPKIAFTYEQGFVGTSRLVLLNSLGISLTCRIATALSEATSETIRSVTAGSLDFNWSAVSFILSVQERGQINNISAVTCFSLVFYCTESTYLYNVQQLVAGFLVYLLLSPQLAASSKQECWCHRITKQERTGESSHDL